MQSKFGRSFRHRSKPAICRRPPPPGPWDDAWPPAQASGLCSWYRQPGLGFPFDARGLIAFRWDPTARAYTGTTTDRDALIDVIAFQYPDGHTFAWFATYYYRGGAILTAMGRMTEHTPGRPIIITDTAYTAGPTPAKVTFSLSAFPLV